MPGTDTAQVSLHGRKLGLDSNSNIIIDGRLAVANPASPAAKCTLFDDFLGDVLADPWGGAAGSDTEAVAPAITAGVGGIVRLACGDDATTTMAVNGSQLYSQLNWKASQGGLVMEARVALSAITTVSVFVGFTDVLSLEQAIHSAASANTITTNATDAVGFVFDTSMADDNWWAAGVAADTDATHADTGVAPTAATYQRLRLEIDTSGNATFYINGQRYAYVADAVTASVALTPTVSGFSRAAAARSIDVDYVWVQQNR